MNKLYGPEVVRKTWLSVQVCVPEDWSDQQVRGFAEENYPCGTTNGWMIRRGDTGKHEERVQCEDREDYVHIVLDA